MQKFGTIVVRQLERIGIERVFGIPGVHNAELYRGLGQSTMQHVLPRHEQGAGFMADGYARVSGKPAACFIISGPGMTNIATAMAQAYADSIPMLVISSVGARAELGTGNGYLHELSSQRDLVARVSAFSHTLLDGGELPYVLGRALAVFNSARPRPVHIEIPVDVLEQTAEEPPVGPVAASPPGPAPDAIAAAADELAASRAPVILAGGGAVAAGPLLAAMAARLDAPVVTTINAKGLLPPGSSLCVGFSPAMRAVRILLAEADVVLAIGSEIGPTDFNSTPGQRATFRRLIRIDIDPEQLSRNALPAIAIHSDAALALRALLEALRAHGPAAANHQGAQRTAMVRQQAEAELSTTAKSHRRVLEVLAGSADDVVIVGDSTLPVYSGNRCHEAAAARSWFNAATGYGTLGYALPAAIGAKLGAPDRAVICLVGDGGLQFSLSELATAVAAGVALPIVLWNNGSYGAIRRHMLVAAIAPIAVDLANPDFLAIARAFGCRTARPSDLAELHDALQQGHAADRPTLIEICDPGPLVQ